VPRRAPIPAVLAGVLVLLSLAGCGGGGGGDGEGGDDLAVQAAEVGALLDKIEALPTTATTAQQFSQQLEPLRDQVQVAIEDVASADAPDELASERDKLSNRLRSLRTQLGRVYGLAQAGDLEAAKAATESLLSLAEIRETIEKIEAGSSGG